MISRDQPTALSPELIVRVSSVDDGTMTLRSLPEDPEEVWQNRKDFITSCGGDLSRTALVYVTYDDTRSYEDYKVADSVELGLSTRDDDIADGLATQAEGLGLFLPVADCCATVLYDPRNRALMLSHLGRHSVEVYGAKKSLEFMNAQYGTDAHDVIAWLSPAVSAINYPISHRGGRGLRELIVNDLRDAGVSEESIKISPAETDKNMNYFSHSEYRKNRRESDGRFAVFAMLMGQASQE